MNKLWLLVVVTAALAVSAGEYEFSDDPMTSDLSDTEPDANMDPSSSDESSETDSALASSSSSSDSDLADSYAKAAPVMSFPNKDEIWKMTWKASQGSFKRNVPLVAFSRQQNEVYYEVPGKRFKHSTGSYHWGIEAYHRYGRSTPSLRRLYYTSETTECCGSHKAFPCKDDDEYVMTGHFIKVQVPHTDAGSVDLPADDSKRVTDAMGNLKWYQTCDANRDAGSRCGPLPLKPICKMFAKVHSSLPQYVLASVKDGMPTKLEFVWCRSKLDPRPWCAQKSTEVVVTDVVHHCFDDMFTKAARPWWDSECLPKEV